MQPDPTAQPDWDYIHLLENIYRPTEQELRQAKAEDALLQAYGLGQTQEQERKS